MFGSAAIGDLVDDGSLVYLWLRPVRPSIHVVAAIAATLTVVTPLVGLPVVLATAMIEGVVNHARMEIGDYTYASAHQPPRDWAATLAPYLYDFSPERLIIGKFCQIADGVQFITASANHRYDGISTFPFAVFGGGPMAVPRSRRLRPGRWTARSSGTSEI